MKTFHWHLLPHNLQKVYQTILLHMQQPRDIYIGGISKLSLETSVLVGEMNLFNKIFIRINSDSDLVSQDFISLTRC